MNKGPVSEAVVVAVKKLAEKGHSAGEIGVILGMSRSAVCGLCFRRGFRLKGHKGRKQTVQDPKPSRKRGLKTVKVANRPPPPMVIAPVGFVKRKQVQPNTIPRCMWRDCKSQAMDFNRPYCSMHLAAAR